MFDLDDGAIQRGPQVIEGLPLSVKAYHYTSMDDFCPVISLELDRLYFHPTRPLDDSHRPNIPNYEDNTKKCLEHNYSSHKDDESEHLVFIVESTTFEHDFIDPNPPLSVNTFFNPRTKIYSPNSKCLYQRDIKRDKGDIL